MKMLFYMLLFLMVAIHGPAFAQTPEENVISYYAVGNSLDGQPLIDRVNVLRFFPVFAFRHNVRSVLVRVYYGSKIYPRMADSVEGKIYWQVKLPKLKLGEAIQRLEVEVDVELTNEWNVRLQEVEAIEKQFVARQKEIGERFIVLAAKGLWMDTLFDEVGKSAKGFLMRMQGDMNEWNKRSAEMEANSIGVLESIRKYNDKIKEKLKFDESLNADCIACRAELGTLMDAAANIRSDFEGIPMKISNLKGAYTPIEDLSKNVDSVRSSLGKLNVDSTASAFRKIYEMFAHQQHSRDSIREDLYGDMQRDLIDSNYTGPSVRRSDIILNDSLNSARILYRNYKTTLRRLPALDPAERLGIFRARYVPFASVGSRFFTPRDSVVMFEVGLAFGDAIVTGDDFVLPEFSLRRLGVAFVITNQLFAEDALVRALALTYDFNSYGSVGVGANFPNGKVESYISFGINKKAFEDVVGKLQELFQ